ncbi:hypothetical protein ZWY2020_013244 [Hordeum vulgare]|nr:hypothetical protein ZWY2020_013244 [Hordeum vulgare]
MLQEHQRGAGLDEKGGLDGHVERAEDLGALEGLRGVKLGAAGHEAVISTSASSSLRRPKSAWERSLTLYSRPDEVFSTESAMEKDEATK